MNVKAEQATGGVPVTVLTVQGDVDASTYQALIAAAREQVAAGAKRILLDLSGVPYISSAGLVALHSTAVLVQGQQPPDPEAGWSTFHSMGRDAEKGRQTVVKLLSPTEKVQRVLDTSGMVQFFEIYKDKAEALASFA
jgi:anti-anti-sigma regulatory factor